MTKGMLNFVIASHRVGAKRRPMTGSAKQSRAAKEDWIASSLTLLAMTVQGNGIFDGLA
jgi:hypothetical protein